MTAKGALRTGDSARTFTLHMYWALAAGALLAVSYRLNHDLIALRIWASVALLTGIGPPLIAGVRWLIRVRTAPADSPVRDTHAWQQHMADEITGPAFQLLLEMADAQAQQAQQYPEPEDTPPWPQRAAGSYPTASRPAYPELGNGEYRGAYPEPGRRAYPEADNRGDRDARPRDPKRIPRHAGPGRHR